LWPRIEQFLCGEKRSVVFSNGNYSAPYETLLLMVLFRMSRPRRLRKEMESFFGYNKSKISCGIRYMVDAWHSVAVKYLDNPQIFQHRMLPYYAQLIFEKSGLVKTVWGFIDGTLRKICRPTYSQKFMYSGHKRAHGLKFQSVVLPEGLFGCMYGPVCGNRHDSYMLTISELSDKLKLFMPDKDAQADENAGAPRPTVYSLYGDPAYPQSQYIFGGFRNPAAGTLEARWNTEMSKVREVVEWGLANLIANWSFLDFKAGMRIFKSPVSKYYVLAAFLCNLRTCYYGNQITENFDCNQTLSIDQYLALVD
jgi:nuclease HARBI1